MQGKVIILDDVMSAGTTAHEIIPLIRAAGAEVAAIVLALNRQERGKGEHSAVAEIEATYHVPVHSLMTLADLIKFFDDKSDNANSVLANLQAYRSQYGA